MIEIGGEAPWKHKTIAETKARVKRAVFRVRAVD
jgi:hypothetical protein